MLPQRMLRNATNVGGVFYNPLIPHRTDNPVPGDQPSWFPRDGVGSPIPGSAGVLYRGCHPAPCAAPTAGGGSDDGCQRSALFPIPDQQIQFRLFLRSLGHRILGRQVSLPQMSWFPKAQAGRQTSNTQ